VRGNGKSSECTPIKHWETLEVLHSDTRRVGRDDLGIVIEVQRPVFEDGRTGRVSMGMVIRRGERMLRLFCRDGSTDEISALREMLDGVHGLDGFTDRFAELRAENDPPPRERESRRERGSGPKPGEVGGGLSRFSGESKRDKRRRKREARERDHG